MAKKIESKRVDTKKTITESPVNKEAVKELVRVGVSEEHAKEAVAKVQAKVEARVTEEQVKELVRMAQDQGLTVSQTSGFYKVEGRAKGLRLYVAKKGSRLDLSGFCVTHPSVKPVTEAEAKAKRIGKVRGQVLNALPADFRSAYELALRSLAVASALMLFIR